MEQSLESGAEVSQVKDHFFPNAYFFVPRSVFASPLPLEASQGVSAMIEGAGGNFLARFACTSAFCSELCDDGCSHEGAVEWQRGVKNKPSRCDAMFQSRHVVDGRE